METSALSGMNVAKLVVNDILERASVENDKQPEHIQKAKDVTKEKDEI